MSASPDIASAARSGSASGPSSLNDQSQRTTLPLRPAPTAPAQDTTGPNLPWSTMVYTGRTLVRAVQHGTDWRKRILHNPITHLGPMESIDALLAKPKWSVRALLPTHEQPEDPVSAAPPSAEQASSSPPSAADEITPAKLHHLLRLSALPLPSTPQEESRLLKDLRAQVHFVKHLQSLDTSGVQPLVSIRDETDAARKEQTIGLQDLAPWLDREEKLGKNGTVRRRKTDVAEAERQKKAARAQERADARVPGVERFVWADLEPSGQEEGRRFNGHYVVKRGKKTQVEAPAG